MPRYDKDKMLKIVSELRKSVRRLQSLRNLSQDKFIKDPDKIGSAKYHFIVAIESSIDMCNHIISRNGYRVPEDYADTFRVMAEVGTITEDFSEELIKMAKFRNRLVHIYWEINDDQLYQILQTKIDDLKELLDSIAGFLKWKNIKPDYQI
ncbi:MAG: DUF86 domain-containing protein [Thermodesulfobacteriota bacterium]|nr:DUF86 domain-containing protein [Thermodesulfobacteriota bacterium]